MNHARLLFVAILVASAGCQTVGPFPEKRPTDIPNNPGSVYLFTDTYPDEESGYYRNGTIRVTLPEPNRTLDDVMLCVYDQNGSVLGDINVGSFSDEESWSASYEIGLTRRPSSIVPYHPVFKEYPNLGVDVVHVEADSARHVNKDISTLNRNTRPYTADVPAGKCKP